MVVAPGFIDMLGQSELTILVNPHLPSKIYQGITTEITGEGGSVAPLNDAISPPTTSTYEHYGITPDWRTFRRVLRPPRRSRAWGSTSPATWAPPQVRRMVLGDDDRAPTPAELERMKALVRDAMRDGAVGVSTSLQYAPAPYATTEELIALAAEARKLGGIYATHMRSEGDAIVPTLDEAIRIGREAHIPVEIWHLKAAGKPNWGRMPEIVARIDTARAVGRRRRRRHLRLHRLVQHLLRLHSAVGARRRRREADRAPEGPGHARAHPQRHANAARLRRLGQRVAGGPRPGSHPDRASCRTRAAAAAGQEHRRDRRSCGTRIRSTPLFDLLIEDDAFTEVAVFGMSEPDVALALQQPWVSIDNDSQGTAPDGLLGQEHPHPRAYGTFPRILRKYVREEQELTLEMPSASSPRCPRSACASPTAAC